MNGKKLVASLVEAHRELFGEREDRQHEARLTGALIISGELMPRLKVMLRELLGEVLAEWRAAQPVPAPVVVRVHYREDQEDGHAECHVLPNLRGKGHYTLEVRPHISGTVRVIVATGEAIVLQFLVGRRFARQTSDGRVHVEAGVVLGIELIHPEDALKEGIRS